MNQRRGILIIGGPGSGKSTQAELLAQSLRGTFADSSGLIRRHAELHKEEVGSTIEVMNAGNLVNDELVAGIVLKFYHDNPLGVCVLSGFPRTEVQADAFEEVIAGIGVIEYLNLELEAGVMFDRLIKRPGSREDDTEKKIVHRIALHKEHSPSVNRYLRETVGDRYKSIDGNKSIKELHAEISAMYGVESVFV